jgi:hypothetical protein
MFLYACSLAYILKYSKKKLDRDLQRAQSNNLSWFVLVFKYTLIAISSVYNRTNISVEFHLYVR